MSKIIWFMCYNIIIMQLFYNVGGFINDILIENGVSTSFMTTVLIYFLLLLVIPLGNRNFMIKMSLLFLFEYFILYLPLMSLGVSVGHATLLMIIMMMYLMTFLPFDFNKWLIPAELRNSTKEKKK